MDEVNKYVNLCQVRCGAWRNSIRCSQVLSGRYRPTRKAVQGCRSTALQNLAEFRAGAPLPRDSVVECGGLAPLFPSNLRDTLLCRETNLTRWLPADKL